MPPIAEISSEATAHSSVGSARVHPYFMSRRSIGPLERLTTARSRFIPASLARSISASSMSWPTPARWYRSSTVTASSPACPLIGT